MFHDFGKVLETIPILLPIIEKTSHYVAEVKVLMQRNGSVIRRSTERQRLIHLLIYFPRGGHISESYSCFAKVKKIGQEVTEHLQIGELFVISIRNVIVDDDEYLVDIGCLSGETTHVVVVIVPPATSSWRVIPPPPREPPERDTLETPSYPIQQMEARHNDDVDLDAERQVPTPLDKGFMTMPNEAKMGEDRPPP